MSFSSSHPPFSPSRTLLCTTSEQKYHIAREDADAIAAFLRPLLEFQPSRRATAAECLEHDWLLPKAEQKEG